MRTGKLTSLAGGTLGFCLTFWALNLAPIITVTDANYQGVGITERRCPLNYWLCYHDHLSISGFPALLEPGLMSLFILPIVLPLAGALGLAYAVGKLYLTK
jgi:hypothetical protein